VVTLALSQYILPERLYPVLEVGSGLLVVGIGAWLFGRRLLGALGFSRSHDREHSHGHEGTHDHAHGHEHQHDHDRELEHSHEVLTHTHGGSTHSHTPPERVTWKALLALGISGGLLPCPEALMVLLITIAAHRVLFGLLLIVSFSTGLAAVLVAFGLMLVYARGWFTRVNLSTGLVPRVLPVASALVIVIAGSVITAQALPLVL
jgi:ABC-type nickel/cobalt efflux system permease component RcnA